MSDFLTSNQIGLITLLVTVVGVIIAVVTYRRNLVRSELSNVRNNLIHRLENLCSAGELQDLNLSVNERGLIYNMNIQVIERDVLKFIANARFSENVNMQKPLSALMVFDVKDIINKRVLFRQRCYQLISRVDQAYFHEIKARSYFEILKLYYYEISGIFYGLFSIYMLFSILGFLFS